MYHYVSTLFDLNKEETLLDLYTGSGAMALYYVSNFKRGYGIDINPSSIHSAKANMKLNQIENVSFHEGDAFDVLKELYDKNVSFDVCVFDPPRSDIDDRVMDLLMRKPIKKLIYVSCNPSTLAKNIKC